MTPKTKNVAIFLGIGIILILVYVFFIKSGPSQPSLSSTSSSAGSTAPAGGNVSDQNSQIAQNFLSLLLNVKSITLNDTIFSDPAFISLQDSSIELIPDSTHGRLNPFAPIGSDVVATPPPTTNSSTNGAVSGGTAPLLGSAPPATGAKTGITAPPKTIIPPPAQTN